MEKTNNFKNKFNFFRKKNTSQNNQQNQNYNSNTNRNTNLHSNTTSHTNINTTSNSNNNQSTNLDQKISALINQPDLIKQENQLEQKPKENIVETKKDFTISYKDKVYTYIIPENILKKEVNSIPFWLLPIQVKLIPNGNEMIEFCNEILLTLSKTGARIEIDSKQENIQKKIKNAEFDKIPYIIIVGPKEKSIHKFLVRTLDGNQKLLSVGAFSHTLEDQLLNKPKTKIQY